MKKKLLTATLVATLSTSAVAVDVQYFVGGEFGSAKMSMDASVLGIDLGEASDRGGFAGLKFGAILNENHRIGVSYNSYNTESNIDLNSYGIGYDYLIKTSTKLTPFVGVGLAKVNYKETGYKTIDNDFDSDTFEMDGLIGTVNLGAVFEITNNFELEAGYRMALIKNVDGIIGYSGVPVEAELGDSNMTYFGINYKF